MRISGGLFVTVLIAAGFAFYLNGRDARTTFDAVNTMAGELREEGVQGQTMDAGTASQMVVIMESILESPDTIGSYRDDLRVMAETAASWAAASAPASRQLHIAVNLRSAVGELRAYGLTPSPAHLARARRHLGQARNSLEGGLRSDSEPQPHVATDGLRDQLQNLEQAQREQRQQVDEALKR